MPQHYQSASAFRTALEARLKNTSLGEQRDLERLRRQVAFERLLARLFADADPPWLLKGGYAFELRLRQDHAPHARATNDIDLSVPIPARLGEGASADPIIAVRDRLQEAAESDLDDWFIFRIGAPVADLDAAPYGGARFPVEVVLAGRRFAHFHLDVGLGDAVIAPPDWLTGQEMLNFAEIPTPRIAVLPTAQQFAEKVHAYSLPREGRRENTRVKDLVDLMLLLKLGLPDASTTTQALEATFARRQTHAIPQALPVPPASWHEPFAALAQECGLDITTPQEAYAVSATSRTSSETDVESEHSNRCRPIQHRRSPP
jgi:nucleotidyltransferase AbiEii toxin of type IV toxin-antitoxin system